MNYSNIDGEYTSYSSVINALKELRKKSSTKFLYLTQYNESSLNDLIINLKNSFNDAEKLLLEADFLEYEYYDFSSIKDMIFYILDDKSLFHHISIVDDLLDSFYNLIPYKKDLSAEEYEILYHNFSFKLIDVEQFFYTKIYEPDEDYNEEVLSEILNSLLG